MCSEVTCLDGEVHVVLGRSKHVSLFSDVNRAMIWFTMQVERRSQAERYLDILLLQQGTPGSNATLSPTCLLVTPGPTSMISLKHRGCLLATADYFDCSSMGLIHKVAKPLRQNQSCKI